LRLEDAWLERKRFDVAHLVVTGLRAPVLEPFVE